MPSAFGTSHRADAGGSPELGGGGAAQAASAHKPVHALLRPAPAVPAPAVPVGAGAAPAGVGHIRIPSGDDLISFDDGPHDSTHPAAAAADHDTAAGLLDAAPSPPITAALAVNLMQTPPHKAGPPSDRSSSSPALLAPSPSPSAKARAPPPSLALHTYPILRHAHRE